jgi:tetratricopeptide (TPR) repeat protein
MPESEPVTDVGQMMTLALSAVDRGDYEPALRLLATIYRVVPADKMPKGLSAYGLCLAKVEKKNKIGADFCQKAIELQPYEGVHWAHQVRIYIAGNNRKKAVEILERGMKKMRNDPALTKVRNEIGYRKAPYFRFLRRTHPLNKLYSRFADRMKRRSKIILIVTAALIWIAMMVGVFLTILE